MTLLKVMGIQDDHLHRRHLDHGRVRVTGGATLESTNSCTAMLWVHHQLTSEAQGCPA